MLYNKLKIKNSKSSFKAFCKDNRGNSLVIVLIGMLMVGILGTMILTLTATNYKANVVSRKNQKTFYANEKAVNDVEAYLGGEALGVANNVYEHILKNYVVTDGATNTTTALSTTAATAKFREYYFKGYVDALTPSKSITGVSTKFKSTAVDSTSYDKLIEAIYNYYSTTGDYTLVTDGSDIKGMTQGDYTFVIKKTSGARIDYSDADGDGENDTITIKNLCVSCEDAGGYYTSITNDFVISSPDALLGFKDTKMPDSFDDLYSYAMVVEGNENSGDATLVASSNLTLNGNAYFGSDYTNGRRSSVLLKDSAKFTAESRVVYSAGPVLVSSNSTLDCKGTGGKDLKFWAKDLITTTGSDGATINIDGNVLVSDDLEVNGTNSNINLSGAYYGYGFRRSRATSAIENDSNITSGFTTTSSAIIQDHETRSSMVVNGDGVNADFTNLNTLIIAGRSFVDLQDGGLFDNATYMTGESVSFKGDQKMYYAKADNPNLPAFLNGRNVITLTEARELAAAAGEDLEDFIDNRSNNGSKNVDASGNSRYDSRYPEVIYRLYHNTTDGEKNMIYFFVYDTNPRSQTAYFANSFATNGADVLREAQTLGIKKFQFDFTNTNIFTVGTIFSYDGTSFSNLYYSGDYTRRNSNVPTPNTMDVNTYTKYVNEIYSRQNLMIPSLRDVDNAIGNVGGTALSVKYADVYDNFVKSFASNKSGKLTDQDDLDLNVTNSYSINKTGYTLVNINTDTNLSTILTNAGIENGVVIVNITSDMARLNINASFTGLLMVNGNAYVNSNSNLTSDEELVKYVFGHATVNDGSGDVSLGEYVLDGYFATMTARNEDDSLNNNIAYTDLVSAKNYRQTNK